MLKLNKGFTLIELLIVISVLGILAVAVLSAINPIEQINRSRDTGSKSDAEQLINAIDRYYSSNTNGWYPWQKSAAAPASTGWIAVGAGWNDSAGDDVLDSLDAGGTAELKESFTTRIQDTEYNTLYVYNEGAAGDSTYVCFMPKSSSFVTEAASRCAGTRPGDFPDSACGNTTNCGTSGNCICLP